MIPEIDEQPQPLTSEPLLSRYDYINIFFLLIVAAGLVAMCCKRESGPYMPPKPWPAR